MEKATVVGAGIGGLAAAIRLAVKGYEVQVYEANAYPGGKLSAFDQGEYRFDAGPSLFTMPELVEELFALAGEPIDDFFEYHQLEEVCRYFYPDDTIIHGYSDPDQFANEVEVKTGVPVAKTKKHLAESAYIYKHTHHLFLEKSLHKIGSYLNKETFKAILNLPFLHLFETMNGLNERKLAHPKLVQLFNRYATYNGSSPFKAPGILNIIPHLEFNRGAFFPKDGMVSITNALFKLAQKKGVQFTFNTKVDQIIIDQKNIKGVLAGGKRHDSSTVVCNTDIAFAYKYLLRDQPAPQKILSQPRSSSALIFYWGISKRFESLILHNIFFSKDYKTEFQYIFDGHTIYHDPTVYVNISSKENPSDAPEGRENWFVMINVPHNNGQDWDTLIAKARRNIIQKLSSQLGVDVESLIENESILDPRTIESRTQSYQGALYGTSSNNRMAAFFRHANFSKSVKNLYFVGGSVHPGGGIPLALSSAKIVDSLI